MEESLAPILVYLIEHIDPNIAFILFVLITFLVTFITRLGFFPLDKNKSIFNNFFAIILNTSIKLWVCVVILLIIIYIFYREALLAGYYNYPSLDFMEYFYDKSDYIMEKLLK